MVDSASSTTADVADTGTVSTPAASLLGGANGTGVPRSCDHCDEGVDVVNRTLADEVPLLKTSTTSRPAAGSIRLTTTTAPFA